MPVLLQDIPPEALQNAPSDAWWIVVIIQAVLTAGGAVGFYIFQRYLPARDKRIETQLKAELEEKHKQLESDLRAKEDEREFRQKSENAALDIAKETIQYFREESTEQQKELKEITKTIAGLVRAVEHLGNNEKARLEHFRTQNGILSELRHELNSQQAKVSMLVDLWANPPTGKQDDE